MISALVAAAAPTDPATVQRKATGFYRVEKIDDVWWFITPEGRLMYSIGVTDCPGYDIVWTPKGTEKYQAAFDRYEKESPSAADYAGLLKSWGFTNAAAWKGNCNDRLPSTPCLVWWRAARGNWHGPKIPQHPKYNVPDVFSPEFALWCDAYAKRIVAPMADDPSIIGWYLDNEEHLPNDEAFQHQYYQVSIAAIRKYDKHHILLGNRQESPNVSEKILKVRAKYFDVLSFNEYELRPNVAAYRKIYEITGRPILIGEFAFGSKEKSPRPAFIAPGIFVEKSYQRAAGYDIFASTAAAQPFIVGTSYYRFHPFGTNDWGILGFDGKITEEFVSRLPAINQKLPLLHAGLMKLKTKNSDYPEYQMAWNDRPHTVNEQGVALGKDGSWAWQEGVWYWECTPGTDMLTFHRERDSLWGLKSGGFLEYRIKLEKAMPGAVMYFRFYMPKKRTAELAVIVNGRRAGTLKLEASEPTAPGPEGWARGYSSYRFNMATLPLQMELPAGENRIRFENLEAWKDRQGPVIHGFFLTNGTPEITPADYGKK